MYGLIGKPLGHSFSADFFNRKFKKEAINESYHLFPLESIEMFPELISSNPDLHGLNVTLPYKQAVIKFLDRLDNAAEEIGAVNVIKRLSDGSLIGYNSDAIGFCNSLKPLLKPHMKRAIVLGTGGASKAVVYVLRKLGIEVTSVSRNPAEGQISYCQITAGILDNHHIIINTTPLGMWPNIEAAPDIPYHLLSPRHLCYDLVYNPEVTTFMRKALEQGAMVKNGLDMLHGQALAAWEIWNNK